MELDGDRWCLGLVRTSGRDFRSEVNVELDGDRRCLGLVEPILCTFYLTMARVDFLTSRNPKEMRMDKAHNGDNIAVICLDIISLYVLTPGRYSY